MDNTEKTAVVAGGTGGIGEGVVMALLNDGYRVYVPVRDTDPSERLKEYVGDPENLRFLPADLCDDLAVAAMRDRILEEVSRIDAVVVSVGAGYFGHRLHKMPRTDWDDSIQDNLATHFNVQRIFIDQLRRQNRGAYITLIGPEAEHIRPDAGMVSIMAAAQKMMTRVLAEESSDSSIRVHAVTAHTTINTRSRGENTNREWITALELGQYVAGLIAEGVPGWDQSLHDLRDLSQLRKMLHRK
jgi:NAD(P)-dependent dehydrogenase (short-subunit alcohol dehydrogenase family)